MVEFMLAISFVFILFVSILQMILLMHAYNTLADAAKEGVRYAIVHGTQNSNCSGPLSSTICTSPDTSNANVKTAVTNFAGLSFQNITPGNVNVAYGPSIVGGANCNNPGCSVRVTVFHLYNPFFGLGWPSITLNAAAEGRIMN
jgi:Flp pilus assembly protein TadG